MKIEAEIILNKYIMEINYRLKDKIIFDGETLTKYINWKISNK